MHLSKFFFVRCVLLGHHLPTMLVHSVRPMSWKHWPTRLNSVLPSSFFALEYRVRIYSLKSRSVNARKYSGPTCAWSGMMCPVCSFCPFSKETLIWLDCFKPFLISLSGMPLVPREVQWVYHFQLGCPLCLEDIRHLLIKGLALRVFVWQPWAVIRVTYGQVGNRISGWNIQWTKINITVSLYTLLSVLFLLLAALLPQLSLNKSKKEKKQPKEKIRIPTGFKYRYLNMFKVP